MIRKIVSGGQTGADRAALDAAMGIGLEHGGWIPRGRKAEDGRLPARYRLKETAAPGYAERTEKNVQSSDATLIVSRGGLTGGSRLTLGLARKHGKPCLHVDLEGRSPAGAVPEVCEWVATHGVEVLNVAGPRASNDSGIYALVRELIELILKEAGDVEGSFSKE